MSRVYTNNVVAPGQTWGFDSGVGAGVIKFTIDAVDKQFADVTYKSGRKGKVALKTLRRGLRHAKRLDP